MVADATRSRKVVGRWAALVACLAPFGCRASAPRDADDRIPVRCVYDERSYAVEVFAGDERFTTYHAVGLPKPYLFPVLAPGGAHVTRGFPLDVRPNEAEDHPHHVSLWFAHGDVNGADFWHGKATTDRMELRDCIVAPGGDAIEAGVDWVRADGTRLAIDRRRLDFGATASARWIDFTITIEPRVPELTFGDTKEGTFALRLAPTLRVEGEVAAGSLRNSAGQTDGDAWGQRARWLASFGPVEGGDVTVALFDHPSNPRHPTWWHARMYGLVAANPFGVHDFEGKSAGTGDLVVREPLTLRYCVLVATGRLADEELEARWKAFARTERPGRTR